ncbi:MAG: GGDEF domain-containing protein [Acidobacteriota bacterium]
MRRLLLPSLALVSALALDLWNAAAVVLERVPQPAAARLALLAAFLLAWRLRRGRIAWACAAVAALGELTPSFPPPLASGSPAAGGSPLDLQAAGLLAAILALLNLGAAALEREWWLWSAAGALRFAVLALQGALVWTIAQPAAQPAREALLAAGPEALHTPPAWWPPSALWSLPLLAAAVLAAAAILFALWRRRSPLEAGLLCALAAVLCAIARPESARLYAAAAGLALLIALVENAFTLAFQDGLTGLPARRALEERLPQLGRTYALAMLDLDHFKKLNDRHGHEVGDQVLKLVASMLRRVPGGGQAFRYGGEEFTVVFAGKESSEAAVHLDALRQRIAARPFTVRSPGRAKSQPASRGAKSGSVEKNLKVTVSIGVAQRGGRAESPEQVLKAADKALYRAKKAGRNRVHSGR